MANHTPENPSGDEKQRLADEISFLAKEFFRYVYAEEQLATLGKASARTQNERKTDRRRSLEETLADIDPEQSRKALQLEEALKKLHGCVVSYRVANPGSIREETEPEPDIKYVKDHTIDLDTLGMWMAGICVEEVPLRQDNLDRRGWAVQPLSTIYDLEIVSLSHNPIEEW